MLVMRLSDELYRNSLKGKTQILDCAEKL